MRRNRNDVCPWRKAYFFDNALRRLFQNPERIVYPFLEEGATALDAGCGMGFFSIAMARGVGPQGRVFSFDIQQPMLDVLMRRAARASVADRITPVIDAPDGPELSVQADFAVACWVLHEVENLPLFLDRVRACLKHGAGFLVMEPLFHVGAEQFKKTIAAVESAGFRMTEKPKIALSRSALFLSSSIDPTGGA